MNATRWVIPQISEKKFFANLGLANQGSAYYIGGLVPIAGHRLSDAARRLGQDLHDDQALLDRVADRQLLARLRVHEQAPVGVQELALDGLGGHEELARGRVENAAHGH